MTTFVELQSTVPIPARVPAQIGAHTVTLTYDAARISAAWLQQAATLPRLALAGVLLDWDVTDAEGAPIRPPADAPDQVAAWADLLAPLSIRAVIEPMIAAIIDDWRGGGKASGGSAGGS